jgi:hypothetical protein
MAAAAHRSEDGHVLVLVAQILGLTTVLHTWGSALTHHPHVHVIVPGGGVALDGSRCAKKIQLKGG